MQDSVRSRRENLLEILRLNKFSSVNDLSERLSVSPITVRRDLNDLHEEGLIERTHGGAKLVEAGPGMDKREVSFYLRRSSYVEEKKAIARVMVNNLEEDQVVILDSSTTGLYFALTIPDDLPLTIITHSAYIPIELANKPNLNIISTGGLFHPKSMCYLGFEAESTIKQFHANMAIFSLKGLTIENGCTDASLLEVKLKNVMVERAQKLWILADHTKLGNIALASFANLNQIDTLITDEKADPILIDRISDRGVNVIVAPY